MTLATIKQGTNKNRFKQIVDLPTADHNQMYDNSPAQVIADTESVTTHAGGSWNGPKNPADIKGSIISMYPGRVYGAQ